MLLFDAIITSLTPFFCTKSLFVKSGDWNAGIIQKGTHLMSLLVRSISKFDFLILHADWREVGMQYYRSGGAILLKFCPTWQNLLGNILSRNSPTFEVNFEHAQTVYFLDSQKLQARLRSEKNPNSYLAIRGCYRLETFTSKSLWQKSFVHDVNFQSLLTSAKNFSNS